MQARIHSPLRRVFGSRSVYRQFQGVGLWMPWSHRLPDYSAIAPAYGQNLVQLAALLAPESGSRLQVVDVGANIGDSTMQICARVSARVLAVEADPYYLAYLRRNVGDCPEVTVAPVLLTTAADSEVAWTPSRRGGTTHFVRRSTDSAPPVGLEAQGSLPIDRLQEAFPAFDDVRLVKSDTDGYDTRLVPELAVAYHRSRPVLFFEYDPPLTARVSGSQAEEVWPALAALGYDRVCFWDNAGAALGTTSIDTAPEVAARLLTQVVRTGGYLDAAVVHAHDPVGHAALTALIAASGD